MYSIQTTRKLLSGGGKQMPVPIHGDLDRGVSELNLRERSPCGFEHKHCHAYLLDHPTLFPDNG
ncbi:MAG: hypothetical protein GY722_01695 [bacterium]|nr:hypothetical protein [bacterium]